jgi:hypothetical protein
MPDNWRSMNRRAASRSCQFLLNRQRSTYSSSTRARSPASFASAADSVSGDARSPGHPGGGRPACITDTHGDLCLHKRRSCAFRLKMQDLSSSGHIVPPEDAETDFSIHLLRSLSSSPHIFIIYDTENKGLVEQTTEESDASPHLRHQRLRQTGHRPGCRGRCAGQAWAPHAWWGRSQPRAQLPGARRTPETACWKPSGPTRCLGPHP